MNGIHRSPAARGFLAVALSTAIWGVTALPLHAQDTRVRQAAAARGWIGVSFEVTQEQGGPVQTIVITDVSEGSPAESAGLRPGDRVIAVNHLRTPAELVRLPELLRLRAGDDVTMMVEREGERRRIRLRAAPRPEGFVSGRRLQVSVQSDSLVETWARSMDSLRLHLRAGEETEEVRIRRIPHADGERVAVVTGRGDRVRAPFEFFVFRGEAHDSLRAEMMEVNRLVRELEERIEEREEELRRRLGRDTGQELVGDEEMRRLRSELRRASARSDRLETAMAEAARATAGLRYEPGVPEARPTSGGASAAETEFRPLTPYLLGRNRVAGAEVVDLKPELARYFEVDSGVLVVDVAPGTPAAIAGIVPGDVVTRIDRVAVRSVEDLRFGVSMAGDTLPITLVREGSTRQVLLRK